MGDHNAGIIEEFRANGGTVGGFFEGATMLLLHTKGAKTGLPRTNPILYLLDGDRYVVFGTKSGAPTDPDWVRNVLVADDARIELGDRTIRVRATQLTGPARDELYARQVERRPDFAEYPKRTTRTIPAIALEPVEPVGG